MKISSLCLLDTLTKKCYGKFGCYSVEHPWNSFSRPVNMFPQSPEFIDPKYCLYTRRNPTTCDPLLLDDPQTLFRSNYVPSGLVYFIAHGFVENGHRPWIMNMTKELLKRSNANVISIDWSGGSDPPYTQAVANIRLVGVMTAHLINMISEQGVGLQTEKIHIIGHSLGAHLASYVGTTLRRTFNQRLGRITGLDPAEPHFAKTDALVRLDPTDAIFVDNIHTDANFFVMGGLGMRDPAGHIDFYPNGGQDQPGCNPGLMKYVTEKGSLIKGVTKMISCNHVRSYQYFIETINSPEKFLAVECKSWEHYLNGSCFKCDYNSAYKNGTLCAPFGFHSASVFTNK
ncbi:Ves G 1 allergen precursor, putative [Pediculus humanus corporis]|uniref:Ves G 1 allergen, putative n=1 Tax=Pediculus humanus subsp. corporis TaxID=121224 RepID=E0VGW4_PEDHC|nr:Ves G 1 allergen precursor, putative [Pediculus humanus corporis]EEB12620.1 Ves G 1 allergen precursor, putative [Pediculus humanus corporis]